MKFQSSDCQYKVKIKCGSVFRFFPCGKCEYCRKKKKEVKHA